MAIELDFLRQLDKFQLVLKKKIYSQYQGAKETRQFGQGLLFKDYREYIPGDDIRFIDWKVYARTDKFFIRRFEEERNMIVHIIVDASASMNYSTTGVTKFDYAAMVGLGFAYMALRDNEKFNFNTFAEGLDVVKARKGTNQLMSIVNHLNEVTPSGKSEFAKSMQEYKRNVTSRSLIVIISDFLYDIGEVRTVLNLFKKSELVVVQVLDPSEKRLNVEGDIILKDSELNTKLRTFISRRLLKKYSEKLESHIANLAEACDEVGALFFSTTTANSVFDIFYHVFSN